jgi:quercetin dioxygenase-like cupin family protein
MQQRATTVNPSEETIKIGPLAIRFLLTGDDSGGSVSVFEVVVPAGQKLAAPAHKNDAYEEVLYGIKGVLTWTVDGTPIEVGPGQARASREARCTASRISAPRMRSSSPSYHRR